MAIDRATEPLRTRNRQDRERFLLAGGDLTPEEIQEGLEFLDERLEDNFYILMRNWPPVEVFPIYRDEVELAAASQDNEYPEY
ncbi:hypothetical protein P3T76_002302 [Phytophthora citrophthora]|uniref:Uncharacterized protein n=1 Tax=Phytophthora citrophthora TaxID=4793 RepID=A0AAD9GXB7_9STRA|nr:hypothetical protein P3T76_002302 [Phytophthora citrophthora]